MIYKCAACGNGSYNPKECDFCMAKIDKLCYYFANIPVKQQLLESLTADMDDIIAYYTNVLAEDQITDIHNCECFENVRKIYPSSIILPLIVNTDGAQLHRVSTNSLWLIQCYQAFLPPAKRYIPANILIVAAHFGKKKPNMHEFFYEFLKEIREIQNNGGLNMTHKGNEYNFMPAIIGLSCDIPAKKRSALHSGPCWSIRM